MLTLERRTLPSCFEVDPKSDQPVEYVAVRYK